MPTVVHKDHFARRTTRRSQSRWRAPGVASADAATVGPDDDPTE